MMVKTAHKRVVIIGLGATVVLLLSVGAVIARVTSVPPLADEAAAMTAAAEFVSKGAPISVRLEPDPFGRGNDLFEVWTDDGGMVRLDKHGRVVGTLGVTVMPEGIDPPLTQASATKVAEIFLAEHHADASVLTLMKSERLSDDELSLFWQEAAPSGARLPRQATLVIRLSTGEISGYHAHHDEAHEVDTEPRIGEAAALKLFADSDRYRDTVLSKEIEPILMTAKDSRGVDRLVWCITFQHLVKTPTGESVPSSGSGAFFDAHTGEDITREVMGPDSPY